MALTFTSLGDLTVRCVGAAAPVLSFPDKAPANTADIVLLSQPIPEEETAANILSWPGEYNESGVSVHGIGHEDGQQVSYVMELDGVRCAFLSSPLREWTDRQIESVGDIDVLVLPAEEAKIAQKLIDEFDPRVLILLPTKDREALDSIAKLVGLKPEARMEEYKLKGSMPAEGREVVVLQK